MMYVYYIINGIGFIDPLYNDEYPLFFKNPLQSECVMMIPGTIEC